MSASYLCGLIGAGIQLSRSPALHEREADEQGLRYVYKLIDLDQLGVGVDALPELLTAAKRMGFAGLNITYPCKQAIIPLLDELSDDARAAVAHAALTMGARQLMIFDVDPRRSAQLASNLGPKALAPSDLAAAMASADGLIHCTPTGMAKMPGMRLKAELLQSRHWVAEIVYFPLETELLRVARAKGCRAVDGGGMAVFQAVGAFRLFTGVEPDAERMRRHFLSIDAK